MPQSLLPVSANIDKIASVYILSSSLIFIEQKVIGVDGIFEWNVLLKKGISGMLMYNYNPSGHSL